MSENKQLEVVPEKPLTFEERRSLLNFRERLAFDAIVAHPTRSATLSPSLIAGCYELFLAGKTTEEIVKINQGAVTLGVVAKLRVEDRWDERKIAYRMELEYEARERVKQTQLEAIDFLSIQMKALQKHLNEKLLKYIATGDPAHYNGNVIISTMNDYQRAGEMLLKLTGQDKEKNINISGEIGHKVTADKNQVSAEALKKSGLTEKQAAGVLAALLEEETKK